MISCPDMRAAAAVFLVLAACSTPRSVVVRVSGMSKAGTGAT